MKISKKSKFNNSVSPQNSIHRSDGNDDDEKLRKVIRGI